MTVYRLRTFTQNADQILKKDSAAPVPIRQRHSFFNLPETGPNGFSERYKAVFHAIPLPPEKPVI